MFSKKASTLAVTKAEEDYIDLVKRQFIRKAQIGLTIESRMHIGKQIARIALTVDKDNFCIGMVEQQAAEFTRCITGTADDAHFNGIIHTWNYWELEWHKSDKATQMESVRKQW